MSYSKLLLCILTVLMLVTSYCEAQERDSQWQFGNHCWLDFSNGNFEDVGEGHFFGNEGTVSISDKYGNLLFSSNGEKIFDRNGQVMPNGLSLGGHVSSTQAALIVPQPGDKNDRFFYVFTTAAELGKYDPDHTGLEYVMVDMSLNNGLGDVSQGSIELVAHTGEKLHATWHVNNKDVWVVTHSMDSNEFHSFLITCSGIEDHVISPTGRNHASTPFGEGCIGAMKISPSGNHIACVYNGIGASPQSLNSYLEVGEFNASTGEVVIIESISKTNGDSSHGYGLEFSPDGSKLYWSYNTSVTSLFQYDLQALNLEASEYEFLEVTEYPHAFSALQLGPDGRIYIARAFNGMQLSVIELPNESGVSSQYEDIGVNLSQSCRFGLPNQWMYPYPATDYYTETINVSLCQGVSVKLEAPPSMESPLIWNTGGTFRGITVSDLGAFWVTTTECFSDTIFFQVEAQEFCLCELFMPNSFTPDGDGLNETYGTSSWCKFPEYNLTIFDRDGHIVFETFDQSHFWDGTLGNKLCPTGIYNWRVTWKNPYVKESESETSEFGHVSLMR